MGLKEYQAKRNFKQTREPAGKVSRAKSARELVFVVQKHAATRLHYDFRLEMEGVLKSWAVPKGFPTQRGDRRLAVEVEDHPIEYGGFEGTIPEGNYGAGTVMLWDRGTYRLEGNATDALRAGKLHFILNGKKLKGEWALVRMRPRGNESKPQWLLLKSGEDMKPWSARAEDRSALSGRSMKQIAASNDRQWQSNRKRDEKAPVPRSRSITRRVSSEKNEATNTGNRRPSVDRMNADLKDLPKARVAFVEPMKALLAEKLPEGAEWIYEIKFDGVRALALKQGKEVRLISRSEKDLTGKYPELVRTLENIPARNVLLDGEVVAVDEQGRPSFQLLQTYLSAIGRKPQLLYYVFDLLNFEGRDTSRLPLTQRKAVAETVVSNVGPQILFSAALRGEPERLVRALQLRGLEGIVAKRADSTYEPGRRTGAWIKFKWTNEQEFVIGGYTEPQGTRPDFGAILVGYYEKKNLIFAGKVGTGFDRKRLQSLYRTFQKLIHPECPFGNLPEKRTRHGGLTAAEMKRCTWLKPELVCQVRFSEWTRDGHLRQPVFLGLREDKKAGEVVRENPK